MAAVGGSPIAGPDGSAVAVGSGAIALGVTRGTGVTVSGVNDGADVGVALGADPVHPAATSDRVTATSRTEASERVITDPLTFRDMARR
jgi:hypothetical protein